MEVVLLLPHTNMGPEVSTSLIGMWRIMLACALWKVTNAQRQIDAVGLS